MAKFEVTEKRLTKTERKVFKKLQDLGSVKDRFVIPEEKIETIDYESETFQQELQRAVARDEKSIELMNLAVTHVRVYDSKETAVEIMNRAYKQCTSMFNRRKISSSTFSLKEAIKAEKWMNSKKRRRHVDQSTIDKNINSFFEKMNEAVLSIKIEIEKRTNKLFNRIKSDYKSDLPIEIPESKSFIMKKANIVAQCAKKPSCKHIRLESNLFLLEDVDIVGVNFRKTNSSYNKASDVANKRGWSIYDQILTRPSKNIHWFLCLNFETSINYASFSDTFNTNSSEGGYKSYDEYVKIQEADQRLKEQLKTKRLAAFRLKFEEDNRPLFEDIKHLKIELSNLIDERDRLVELFSGLTTPEDSDTGLTITSLSKLDKFIADFRDMKHYKEAIPYIEAVHISIQQKIEAKTVFYEIKDIAHKIKVVREKIKFLEKDKVKRKENYAMELGLVNIHNLSLL